MHACEDSNLVPVKLKLSSAIFAMSSLKLKRVANVQPF